MKPGIISGWPLYPLLGPPLGLLVLLTAMVSTGGEKGKFSLYLLMVMVLYSYLFGGVQALLVGLIAANHASFYGLVPMWVPLTMAVVESLAIVILVPLKEALNIQQSALVVAIHLVPALLIWTLVETLKRVRP